MRFIHDNLYPLLAACILIEATAVWFNTEEPESPRVLTQARESWSLPKLEDRDPKKSTDAIVARNLWGVVAAPIVAKEPEWRVLGIAKTGSDQFIVLAYEGKPIEMLKIGDKLPDGLEIVQIDDDRFFVMTPDNKKLAFGIYKNVPAK